MADEKQTSIEVALFNSLDEYLELYKLVKAFNYVYSNALQYFGPEKVVDGRINATDDEFIAIIQNDWANLGYSSQPSLEEILRAIASSRKLTGEADWGKALKLLKDNPHVLQSSYVKFKEKAAENVSATKDAADNSKTDLKANQKENRKQKRRRFWGIVGKVATVAITAALAGGGLFGVFSLAGGLAGIASISTMPFLTLSLVAGTIAYRIGKSIVGKIWNGLNKVIDSANAIIKNDASVLGSNKSLKNAKTLAKQNQKAYHMVNSHHNAYSAQNSAAYKELEGLVASISNATPGHTVDLGPANIAALAPTVETDVSNIFDANANNNNVSEIVVADPAHDDNPTLTETPQERGQGGEAVPEIVIDEDSELNAAPAMQADNSGAGGTETNRKTGDVARENTFYGFALPRADQAAILDQVVEEATEEFDDEALGAIMKEVKNKVAQHFINNSADYEANPESIAKEIKVQVFKQQGDAKKPKYYVTTTPEEVEEVIKQIENQKKKSNKHVVVRGENGEADDLTISGFDKVSTKIDVSKMAEHYVVAAKKQMANYIKNAEQREKDVAVYSSQTAKTNDIALTQAIENVLSVRLFGRVLERDENGMLQLPKDNQIFAEMVHEVGKYAKKYYSGAKMDYVHDGIELSSASNSSETGSGINGKVTMAEVHAAYQSILLNQEFSFVELVNFAEVSKKQSKVKPGDLKAMANLENIIIDHLQLDETAEDYKEVRAEVSTAVKRITSLYSGKAPTETQIRELYQTTIGGKNLDIVGITNDYGKMLERLAIAEQIEDKRIDFGHVTYTGIDGKTVTRNLHNERDNETLRAAIHDYVETLTTNAKRADEIENKIYQYYVSDLYELDGMQRQVEVVEKLPTLKSITVNKKKFTLDDIREGVNEKLIDILRAEDKKHPAYKNQERLFAITNMMDLHKEFVPKAKVKDYDHFIQTILPKILEENGMEDDKSRQMIATYLTKVLPANTDIVLDLPEGALIEDIAAQTRTYFENERAAEQKQVDAENAAIAERVEQQTQFKDLHKNIAHLNGKTIVEHKGIPNSKEILYQITEMTLDNSFKDIVAKYGIDRTIKADYKEALEQVGTIVEKLEAWFAGDAKNTAQFDNTVVIDGEKVSLVELEKAILERMKLQKENGPQPPKPLTQQVLNMIRNVISKGRETVQVVDEKIDEAVDLVNGVEKVEQQVGEQQLQLDDQELEKVVAEQPQVVDKVIEEVVEEQSQMVKDNEKEEQVVENTERKVEKLTQRDIDRDRIKEKYKASTKQKNFNVKDYEESFLRLTLKSALGGKMFVEDIGAIGRYLSTQYDGDLKLPSDVTMDEIMKLLDEYEAKRMSERESEGPEL